MKVDLSIGIDLGSDTIKIAFAYKQNGNICYGKFDNKPILTQIALPALAYYDINEKKWVFCDQVGKGDQSSFITVVKIKSLISLLSAVTNPSLSVEMRAKIGEENAKYYYKGEHFPKFFFPARKKMLENFKEMVDAGQTFVAKGYTPKTVCEAFFRYVETIVSARIAALEKESGLEFKDYKVALVHPSSVGQEYIDCVCYLIHEAFKKVPHKILTSNKALAIFAEHRKAIGKNDDFLVFDMAEEDITVARIGISGDAIIVDGKDGHNDPCHIGGVDVDEAIVRRLEASVGDRETVGTPPNGTDGHIVESGVYGKQYLLMKDIKKAKVLFSKYANDPSKFADGVPITLSWDLWIQRKLTRQDIKESIGVATDSGLAKEIYKYILTELERPLNYNIGKIFVSGGLSETYSLLDYLRGKLAKDNPKVKIMTFDDGLTDKDEFHIQAFEDSVFAPAVGGAIASLTNKKIKTVLSLSYATWGTVEMVIGGQTRYKKVLKIFANRGEEIAEGGGVFAMNFSLQGEGISEYEELFSTFITNADIEKRKIKADYYANALLIGDAGTPERQNIVKLIDLKTVSGGRNGHILFKYKGEHVKLAPGSMISIREGMRVDKDGRAHPIVENVSETGRRVSFTVKRTGEMKGNVYAQEITIDSNLTDFDTVQG